MAATGLDVSDMERCLGGQGGSVISEAIALAAQAHAGQKRADGTPYIFHPLRVMMSLGSNATDAERIAAVLHDVVEDTPIEAGDILVRFGGIVGAAVIALTREAEESYEAHIERVRRNPVARAVKQADLQDNLADLPSSAFRLQKKIDLSTKYIKALDRLRKVGS